MHQQRPVPPVHAIRHSRQPKIPQTAQTFYGVCIQPAASPWFTSVGHTVTLGVSHGHGELGPRCVHPAVHLTGLHDMGRSQPISSLSMSQTLTLMAWRAVQRVL